MSSTSPASHSDAMSHKTLDYSVSGNGEDHKTSAGDPPMWVNQSLGLVGAFPNELPNSLPAIKEHWRCTYAQVVFT
jgi:hypothetical protein